MDKKQVSFTIPWPHTSQAVAFARKWLLPNPGTLVLMIVLALVIPALAAPMRKPLQQTNSTNTISYQGRLADSGGTPLTGKYNLEFRIYDVPTGSTPLWTEMWTGANSVDVSDGLFNVMLGSINSTLTTAIQGRNRLYLGITVGTDSEMVPRVQLGSVPFSMQALTVSDGSITTSKIANGAVTQAKLGADVSLVPPAGSITTTMLADGAVTEAKLASGTLGMEAVENAFTRDLAVGSGDQSITGLGFQPTALIVMFLINATDTYGQGFAAGPTGQNVVFHNSVDGKHYSYTGETNAIIDLYPSPGAIYSGRLKSFDPDGFTITWTRIGSPTGILWVKFIAFR